jgi:hypothetical protein
LAIAHVYHLSVHNGSLEMTRITGTMSKQLGERGGDEDDSLGQQLSREEDDSFREQLFFDEIEDDSIRERCGGTQLSKTIHSLDCNVNIYYY